MREIRKKENEAKAAARPSAPASVTTKEAVDESMKLGYFSSKSRTGIRKAEPPEQNNRFNPRGEKPARQHTKKLKEQSKEQIRTKFIEKIKKQYDWLKEYLTPLNPDNYDSSDLKNIYDRIRALLIEFNPGQLKMEFKYSGGSATKEDILGLSERTKNLLEKIEIHSIIRNGKSITLMETINAVMKIIAPELLDENHQIFEYAADKNKLYEKRAKIKQNQEEQLKKKTKLSATSISAEAKAAVAAVQRQAAAREVAERKRGRGRGRGRGRETRTGRGGPTAPPAGPSARPPAATAPPAAPPPAHVKARKGKKTRKSYLVRKNIFDPQINKNIKIEAIEEEDPELIYIEVGKDESKLQEIKYKIDEINSQDLECKCMEYNTIEVNGELLIVISIYLKDMMYSKK
jgi:hypothetical protein